jgi:hypothetical protein
VCDLNLHHHDHLRSSITTVCPHNEKHSGEWMAIPLSDCTMADSTTATTTVRPLMESLATMGLGTLMNTEIWTPDGKTNHIVSSSEKSWEGTTFSPPHLPSESDIPMDETTAASTDHVLVWTGTLVNCYGSDIPAVRVAARLITGQRSCPRIQRHVAGSDRCASAGIVHVVVNVVVVVVVTRIDVSAHGRHQNCAKRVATTHAAQNVAVYHIVARAPICRRLLDRVAGRHLAQQ